MFSTVLLAALLSSTAEANPISTPFDYAFEIAIFNFPINGFLLLAVYFALVRRGASAMYFGTRNFVIVFLMGTTIITATGGIVDSVAYTSGSFPIFVVATLQIGMVAGLVAYRFIRLDFEASWVVAIVFFSVNLISWSLLVSDTIIFIAWDYCVALWILFFAFFVTLMITAKEHQGGIWSRSFSAMSYPVEGRGFPEEVSAYPIKVAYVHYPEASNEVAVESTVVAIICVMLLVALYAFWLF